MNRLSGIHSALWFNITEIRCSARLIGPEYAALRHLLVIAHAAAEPALVEARRRVRLNEEQPSG